MNKKKKQKLCLLDLLDQVGMCQTLLRIYEKKKKVKIKLQESLVSDNSNKQ